jgi:hypothetical protein
MLGGKGWVEQGNVQSSRETHWSAYLSRSEVPATQSLPLVPEKAITGDVSSIVVVRVGIVVGEEML